MSMMTYILLHKNSVHIILFNLKKIQNIYRRTEKKIVVKAFTKTLLWNANYDRENNDFMIAFLFFDKFYMILFHMLDTFYLSGFFPKYYSNKLCFQLLQNITWTMNNTCD